MVTVFPTKGFQELDSVLVDPAKGMHLNFHDIRITRDRKGIDDAFIPVVEQPGGNIIGLKSFRIFYRRRYPAFRIQSGIPEANSERVINRDIRIQLEDIGPEDRFPAAKRMFCLAGNLKFRETFGSTERT